MSIVFCPACKRRTRGPKCQHCGASLEALPDAHYLVTSAGEALPLVEGKPFLLGRSTDADLVAHSTDVSRQHAQVIWGRDKVPLVQDLDARHGTFLNGDRLEPHAVRPLTHGDRVRLASNTVFFYFFVPQELLREEINAHGVGQLTSEFSLKDIAKRQETRRAKRPGTSSADRVEPLPTKGDLRATHGAQLLALLKAHGFTGRVEFFDGALRGHVELLNGRPSRGVMGRSPSDKVLTAFGDLRSGSYRVVQECPHEGCFSLIPANDLLVELYEQEVTGILSLFREDDPQKLMGRLVIVEGVCRSAGYGRRVSVAALEHVGALTRGRFRFQPKSREDLDGRLSSARGIRETIRPPSSLDDHS